MDRKEFIEAAGVFGICSCALFANPVLAEEISDPKQAEIDHLKWKLNFVSKRFAKLVTLLYEKLEEKELAEIFETMGRACAKEFKHEIEPFKGNPEGFLESIQNKWVKSATWDKDAGTVRIVDKAKECTCAFVDAKITPGHFCHCTIGWQKQAYETVFGQPVSVKLEESILRGGKKCAFCIKLEGTKDTTS